LEELFIFHALITLTVWGTRLEGLRSAFKQIFLCIFSLPWTQ